MATVGTKIRKIRELKNLKQDYMAEKLGISVTAYGKLEREENEISMERLTQIANALEIPPQEILAFDERVLLQFLSSATQCGIYHNTNNYGLSENERKLYEDKIRLLEEKIEYLNRENEMLRK